ncbi:CHAT domain-containing protein [Nocardia sp. SYP-A9097]|uniref:CHAT domain-containing protein n=1 Tax=Nocardia sp. SYP-A9097 TaxID=2663237 RepID=UPI00129A7B0A|nr:CHAT domain-containing protein [Nocardia sp. SYP-A9097]MRH91688.1 CHAT domain-containing protein [Nocardia sp. SYP-A9097]
MTITSDVLVRAVDAGDTYLSWRWLDDVRTPAFEVLSAAATAPALTALELALGAPRDGERRHDAMRRALSEGAFTDIDRERELARMLTEAVLPQRLRAEIRRRLDAGARVCLRLTPSPRLTRVPWELLCLNDDQRLLEIADVVYEPPAAVHAERARCPGDWETVREFPPLFVIDPAVPLRSARRHELGHVLTLQDLELLSARIEEYIDAGRIDAADGETALQHPTNRVALGTALRTPRSRFFYLGHVTSSATEPGSAAIHLTDTVRQWGMAAPLRAHDPNGVPIPDPEDHRPFAALDLLLGTTSADRDVWPRYGFDGPRLGCELWPMPHRVALIACEGGADYRAAETFGLVMAMVNAGAALVTTTRWTLPADRAIRALRAGAPHPTTTLALRVDAAHEGPDPLGELARWQREQLRQWRATGDLAYTPLVWAALTHTVAPRRTVSGPPPQEVDSADRYSG